MDLLVIGASGGGAGDSPIKAPGFPQPRLLRTARLRGGRGIVA